MTPNPSSGSNDRHADLVAFALGQLDESEATTVRERILGEPELAAEFESIRCHLDLHTQVREILPAPGGFARLAERLEQEPVTADELPAPMPSIFRRYWMSLAAAMLLITALIIPKTPEGPAPAPTLEAVSGSLTRDASGAYTANGVARVYFGTGVTLTVDANTVLIPLDSQRLALKAGRIFLEIQPQRRGFQVVAGKTRLTTLGTAFSVERKGETGRVAVESGTVRLERVRIERVRLERSDWQNGRQIDVTAGRAAEWPSEHLDSANLPSAGPHVRWFEIPSLSAKILNATAVVVVLRNEMIDVIRLTPPTGGEPLFYATVGARNFPHDTRRWPHDPSDWGYNVVLNPGEKFTFEMKLPEPLKKGDQVTIRVPSLGLATQALRAGDALKATDSGTQDSEETGN